MINKIHLVGRAGRDPEIRYFESGKCVATLSLAVNYRRDQSPDWFDLELWSKQAEIATNYIKKGNMVGIIGKLKIDQWKDKITGKERSKPIIVVDELHLL